MDFSFLDSMLDTVWVVDADGVVVYCNDSAATLLKTSTRRLIGKATLAEHVEFSDASVLPSRGAQATAEPAIVNREIDYRLLLKEGSGKLQISVNIFEDALGPRWILVGRDTTLEETLHRKHHAQLKALEDYSRNLEVKVEERTAELKRANVMLEATMNSLGQGFLIFDGDGRCENIFTRACEDVLESKPAGSLLHDVLRLTGQDRENLDLWLRAIFEGALDFGSLRDLGPRHYAHTAGRFIRLDFYPIQDGERVHRVVMVATDETEQRTAKLALEQERGQARMILKAVRARQQFGQFLDHLRAVIDQEMTRGELKVEESFRTLHTIEGEAGLFSVQFARDHARKTQEVLEPARSGWVNDDTALRQQFRSSIESFKEHFEEFLIEQRELLESLDIVSGPKCEISREWAERFAERLRRENKDLYTIFRQEALSESLWRRLAPYSDLVSGLAEKLGKNVELRFDGEDIKVESKDYQGFLDSLVHVFRNAVDHGMETPEERECSGKPNVGRIHVKMLMERRDQVEGLAMEIKDDGRGVDIDKVRIKLAEKFPSTDWMRAPREDVLRGLFLPGFSSLDSVGEFSGRGVGLDAVKSAVESLGGSVEIFSEWERGTTFRFWLPQREALRQVV